MRKQIHEAHCPVLRDKLARAEYKFQSVTLGQPGCPFCEMEEVEEDDAAALKRIKAALMRA